jgi:hypothetical protein
MGIEFGYGTEKDKIKGTLTEEDSQGKRVSNYLEKIYGLYFSAGTRKIAVKFSFSKKFL